MTTILQDLNSKSQRSEGGEESKGGREDKEDWKNAKTGNKSNIKLKLSNFRYHINYFLDFSNKLQINAAKSTWDQTNSDKAPFNYILKIILNKKSKIWNTNELIDAFRNKGSTEWNSTRLVNTSCLIENIDENTTHNGMSTIFQDLSNKSRPAEEHRIRDLIFPWSWWWYFSLQYLKGKLISICMLVKVWSHTSLLLFTGTIPEIVQWIWELMCLCCSSQTLRKSIDLWQNCTWMSSQTITS